MKTKLLALLTGIAVVLISQPSHAEIKNVEIKMEIDVEVTDCYTDYVRLDNTDCVRTETTPLNGTDQYCEEISEKGYKLQGLSKHLEVNRTDDDICLSIRYMVS